MLKGLFKKYLYGKIKFQGIFERMYQVALVGMNVGAGSDVKKSGEIHVIRYLGRILPKDIVPVIFDVGANIGTYTKGILSDFGRDVRIYCFEPSGNAYGQFVRNVPMSDQVRLFRFGFGHKKETVPLYADVKGSGLGSVFTRDLDHLNIRMEKQEDIFLDRLDDFCAEQKIPRIQLLKIDVEGNELNVLKGAENLIRTESIDYIQFEFGGCNLDSRTYFKDFYLYLHPHFKIYRIVKDGFVLLEPYRETYELFITTNFLAVSRRLKTDPILSEP